MAKSDWGVYAEEIWQTLLYDIKNEYGVAGLMANLWGESNLIPFRKQGDFTPNYTASRSYTEAIDSGATSRATFMNDAVGYGLAQWTYYSRKADMYDKWKTYGGSIGGLQFNLAYLVWELQNKFPGVWQTLINATSTNEASDKVLIDFENPADIPARQPERRNYAARIYTDFTGTPPGPGPGPTPTTQHKMPIWMYLRLF